MASVPVVVLDRDGTIIEDRHYINKESDVVFYPGAEDALKQIRDKGYAVFLVSNQSGVGRGWISQPDFHKVHTRFVDHLKDHGFTFDEIAYCFHTPEENCLCRKPGIGLAPKTVRGQSVDWSRSYVVGDHLPDMGLAEALEANPCLVLTGKGAATLAHGVSARTKVYDSVALVAKELPLL
jgi:D-glycero-D-manno-heptose 1,7-bisphosphate phosphatase